MLTCACVVPPKNSSLIHHNYFNRLLLSKGAKIFPLIIHNVCIYCDGPLIIVCTYRQMNQRITHQTPLASYCSNFLHALITVQYHRRPEWSCPQAPFLIEEIGKHGDNARYNNICEIWCTRSYMLVKLAFKVIISYVGRGHNIITMPWTYAAVKSNQLRSNHQQL